MYGKKCQPREATANSPFKNIKYASNTQLVWVKDEATYALQILTSAICINSIPNCSNPFLHLSSNFNKQNSEDNDGYLIYIIMSAVF